VDALVGQEVGLLAEALAALCAGEGALPRVHPAVGQEVGPLAEALPAVPTPVGFLSGVDPLVRDEALLLSETFPALGAAERAGAELRHPAGHSGGERAEAGRAVPLRARPLGRALPTVKPAAGAAGGGGIQLQRAGGCPGLLLRLLDFVHSTGLN